MNAAIHTTPQEVPHIRFLTLEQQIRPWVSVNDALAQAFLHTPREDFVPEAYRAVAWCDTELPLGNGQVMLSPKVQVRMIADLQLRPTDHVLQIGAGSGYMTALMAQLVAKVTAFESHKELANAARTHLLKAQITNANIMAADIRHSQLADSFDTIIFCGALAQIPEEWVRKLKPQGRLIAIVGQEPMMRATLVQRTQEEGGTSTRQAWDTLAPYLQGFTPVPSFQL